MRWSVRPIRRRGFSLPEVLVAILILVSALLVELTMLPRSHGGLHQGREYQTAALLAEKLLEEYQGLPFTELQSRLGAGSVTDSHCACGIHNGDSSHVSYAYTISGLSVTLPGEAVTDPNTMGLQVVVAWTSYASGRGAIPRTLTSQTLVREVP